MQAGINTAKAVRPMTDVMNHPQTVRGRRHMLSPLVRMSSVVVMKFSDPNSWPTQNKPIEIAQSMTPLPCPGPETAPTALSGAYCVHPPRVGPSLTKKEESSTRKPLKVTQNDIMLKWGKGMSSAPTCIGKK